MSEENNKPSEDEKKTPPLCDVLIGTAIQYSSENPMSLAEMVGHFNVGARQIYDRAIAGFRQQQESASQTDAPAEGGDTEKIEDALTVEDGGKA